MINVIDQVQLYEQSKIYIQQIFIDRQKIKMILNSPDTIRNKYYNFKPIQTIDKHRKKQINSTRSHKSFNNDKKKLNMMYQINKKYQQEFVNNQFYKLKQLEKYSPKKNINKIQLQKSFQNLSPLKIIKASSSKQRPSDKKLGYQSVKNLQIQQKNFTLFGQKFTQKKIIQNQSSLPEISQSQITLSKLVEDSWLKNPNQPIVGYWITHNKLVSLFPINNRKIDKVPVINQPYIVPMLGCLTIKSSQKKSERFIITELHQKTSLRDILNEFQPLDEQIVKTYIRKIILCVWNLHKNRIAHNRLTLQAFLCDQNGDILLNMLKSSTKPLTQKQRFQETYSFPPQMLLSRTNYDSMKNDIWGIGCIALELLTNYNHKNNAYHPYNNQIHTQQSQITPIIKSQNDGSDSPITKQSTVQIFSVAKKQRNFRFLTSFEASRMSIQINLLKDSSNILQKVKRLIQIQSPTLTNQSLIYIDLCQSVIMKEISPMAADFVKRCLSLKLQKRPSIDELMFHQFLK